MTVNETHIFSPALVNEVRAGYNRINITLHPANARRHERARHQRRPDAAHADRAARRSRSPARAELRRTGGFPSGRDGDDVRGRRHGDLPARQPHRQVRRRSPAASSTTASTTTRARSPIPAWRRFQQGFGSAFNITLGDAQAFNALRQRRRRVRPGFRSRSDRTSSWIVGLRYDYLAVADREPTTSSSRFDPATSSLLQIIGTGGFDQVHEERQRLPAACRRHLEPERRRQDRSSAARTPSW